MNNFAQRVLFAVPAAALFVGILWFGGWPFNVLCVLIALFIVFEMAQLYPWPQTEYSDKGSSVKKGILMTGTIALATYVLGTTPLIHLNIYVISGTILMMGVYAFAQGTRIEPLVYALLSGLYAPVAFRLLIQMRDTDVPVEGIFLLLILFMSVWGNDVFAYLGGKQFGRHKLAPTISPGKTWEGFASGFIGAAVGFFLIVWMASQTDSAPAVYTSVANKTLSSFWPIIILISLFGPVGDLLESRLKRKKGVKDSSSVLPGHGGFFDRFDALIPSVLVVWAYFELLRYLG